MQNAHLIFYVYRPIAFLVKNRENIKHRSSADRYREWATKALKNWCALGQILNNPSVNAFIKILNRYRYNILTLCVYPTSTGRLEGVNNKIKVIKRKS